MKDTFEEVYTSIWATLAYLPYWNIDSIVAKPKGEREEPECDDAYFDHLYTEYTDTKSGYIYLPYNNKYIKVFFYE